jgi:heme/copper-type cytochrome/quinol oxidase subunit 3
VLLFVVNATWNLLLGRGRIPERNPWGAGTLDWATELPPPDDGYRHIPVISSRYPLWEQSDLTGQDPETQRLVEGLSKSPETWRATFVTSVLEAQPHGVVRLAMPSGWPIWAGVCLTVAFVAELFDLYPILIGSLLGVTVCTIGWLWPSAQERRLPETDSEGRVHGLPAYLLGSASPVWWAMLFVLVVAAVALALLVFSYFYLGMTAGGWPPPGVEPPALGLALVSSVVLLPTAPALWFAERGIRHDSQTRLQLGLVTAFGAGLLFVLVSLAAAAGFGSVVDTAYGSAAIVLVGYMSVIAAIGVVMTGVVQVQAWLGYFTRLRYLAIQNLGLYWAFSVVGWLVVLVTVYVSPRLM